MFSGPGLAGENANFDIDIFDILSKPFFLHILLITVVNFRMFKLKFLHVAPLKQTGSCNIPLA